MRFAGTFRRASAAAVLAAAAALVWGESDEAAVVQAQQLAVVCDQDWNTAVTGRVNCFVDSAGRGRRLRRRHPVPPPGGSATKVGNFQAGAQYWDYRVRRRGGLPLLYCSASTPVRGPEPPWRAEAMGGAIRISELDYGRPQAPADSDRLVETFWGGRTDTRRWTGAAGTTARGRGGGRRPGRWRVRVRTPAGMGSRTRPPAAIGTAWRRAHRARVVPRTACSSIGW